MAEDNAIEDTMYHLHRALNAGRIDLDRFIKVRLSHFLLHFLFILIPLPSSNPMAAIGVCIQTTRDLAEEQFMKRALIEKIEQGMTAGGYQN